MSRNQLLVVIAGPSGVGKTSIIKGLRDRGLDFHFVVNATSREPRSGEKDGVDYHFVDASEFGSMIEKDELLEWAEVHGNYYGVPKQQIRDALNDGRHVLLIVDPIYGARTIRLIAPDSLSILILPKNLDELRDRMIARGMSGDELDRRMEVASSEMDEICQFDYDVRNVDGNLEYAVDIVMRIIEAESFRIPSRRVRI